MTVSTPRPRFTSTPRPRFTSTPRPIRTPVPAVTATPVTPTDPYVLYFHFGVTCSNSRRTAPAVETFYKNYTGHIQVIGVPVKRWGTDVQAFRKATGITFPVKDNAGPTVDTSSIPVIVLVNQRTNAQTVISRGAVSYQVLSNNITNVLLGKKVTVYRGVY